MPLCWVCGFRRKDSWGANMCIDLFAPGYCIDVSFMLEQIWICPGEKSSDLKFEEIFDIRIVNRKGNKPLDCIWMLLPHKYVSNEGGGSNIQVFAMPLTTEALNQRPEWNWAFDHKLTSWQNNQTYISRAFSIDPPDIRCKNDPDFDSNFGGKILTPEVCYPDVLSDEHKELFADDRICKTLLCLKLNKNQCLQPGESGWMRLVCNPVCLDGLPTKKKVVSDSIPPLWFERNITMLCPIMLRDKTEKMLGSFRIEDKESKKLLKTCDEIRQIIFGNIFKKGTST